MDFASSKHKTDHPINRIDELLSWNVAARMSSLARAAWHHL